MEKEGGWRRHWATEGGRRRIGGGRRRWLAAMAAGWSSAMASKADQKQGRGSGFLGREGGHVGLQGKFLGVICADFSYFVLIYLVSILLNYLFLFLFLFLFPL